jgi:hypothetical protein
MMCLRNSKEASIYGDDIQKCGGIKGVEFCRTIEAIVRTLVFALI